MSRSTPKVEIVTLTTTNTEYIWKSRGRLQQVIFQVRDATALRFAFETGKVAGSTDPYFTLKANGVMTFDGMDVGGTMWIYFAATGTGKIVEITSIAG